mmetsp:Transcript_17382/g.39730  ORF Transcript_17382/g.39730 Transcript_17382/m.39730 type:complete len:303 (-) Transcript_17382:377-1285(-)
MAQNALGAASSVGGGVDIERMLDDWCVAKRRKDFRLADQLREQLKLLGVDAQAARPPGSLLGDVGAYKRQAGGDQRFNKAQPAAVPGVSPLAAVPTAVPSAVPAAVPTLLAAGSSPLQLAQLSAGAPLILGTVADVTSAADRLRECVAATQLAHARQLGYATAMQPPPTLVPTETISHWAAAAAAVSANLGSAELVNAHALTAPGPSTIETMLDDWCVAKRKKDFALADKLREQLKALGVDAQAARPPGSLLGDIRAYKRQAGGDPRGPRAIQTAPVPHFTPEQQAGVATTSAAIDPNVLAL